MAASPVPGERPAGFRRSSSQFASIPQRSLSFHEKVGLAKDDAAADVLYTHPSVRIYSFQPPTDALNSLDKTKKTLPDADYPIDAIEVLPWRARTETLAARGKLIIEKVQGSVHFLKAGELIHTIMKNSQCWCVDGESKFVMRVGRLRYQRIEMPTNELGEKQKVEEFKEVISKILKFEKTPCPFIRAFQVDLPEDAITPRRRGTWKRKESLDSVPPEDEPRSVRRTKTSRTMSMRAMPPSAFPTRSLTQLDMERPRTASTPTSTGRFSFPDVRTESPANYTSGEDNTDSERHDSESDRPETGHSSEVDESDRESNNIPIIRSPLNNVQLLSPVSNRDSAHVHGLYGNNEIPSTNEPSDAANVTVASLNDFESSAPGSSITTAPKLESLIKEADQSPSATSGDLLLSNAENSISRLTTATPESPQPEEGHTQNVDKDNIQLSVMPPLRSGASAPSGPEMSTIEHIQLTSAQSEESTLEISFNETPKDRPTNEGLLDNKVHTNGPKSNVIHESSDQKASELAGAEDPTVALPAGFEATVSYDDLTRSRTDDDAESTASLDSFHTLLSDDENSALYRASLGTRPFQHRRELSEMTVTAASLHGVGEPLLPPVVDAKESIPDDGQTDQSESEHMWPVMPTPGAFTDESEIRRRLKHRRSLSPLPPASILQTGNQVEHYSPIPAALLQKAATLAVVKPIEVFVFVVQVLARIAGGATMSDLVSGDLFRNPGVRRTASGTFDQNIRGRQITKESDEEDDYGMPVYGRRKSSNKEEKSGFALNQEIDDAASFASID